MTCEGKSLREYRQELAEQRRLSVAPIEGTIAQLPQSTLPQLAESNLADLRTQNINLPPHHHEEHHHLLPPEPVSVPYLHDGVE